MSANEKTYRDGLVDALKVFEFYLWHDGVAPQIQDNPKLQPYLDLGELIYKHDGNEEPFTWGGEVLSKRFTK